MMKYRFGKAELSLMEDSRIPFAVYQLVDKRVVTLVLSAGFCDLFGYERDEAYLLMANGIRHDIHPDDKARAASASVRFASEGGTLDVVYRVRAKGAWRIVHSHGEHVYPEPGVRLVVVWYTDEGAYDATDGGDTEHNGLAASLSSALREATLYRQSVYDQLTGLPKMSYFFDLAIAGRDRMLANGEKPALLFFNLVGMRFFNKRHGFSQGDALLRAFSEVLVKHYGNEGCGRIAQDNFAAVTSAEHVEETLIEVLQECETMNEGNTLPVRVGIFLKRDEDVDVSTACDRAKFACVNTDQPHVSGFRYFDDEMYRKSRSRQYIIDNLERALRERWIQVHYQPIVRTTNGRVCDEEALARWVDPERGSLSPAEFIPVLEDAKLIYRLDLYVLDCILEKVRLQQERGLHVVPHSLNLSRTDFDCADMVEEISRRVDKAGLEHGKITIEITESVVGSDFEFIQQQVKRFHDLGFQVWMDDFGSGYSSLDVLQSVHFDLIKFDMSFLRKFDQGEKSKIILTELMKMAMDLGIDTVVEGVETQEQVDFLRGIGCNKLQGFFYCRPISLAAVFERYEKGIQIGFENPRESNYYAAVSRVNMYDLSVFAHDERPELQHYFDAIPMAMIEIDVSSEAMRFIRCNTSYQDYMLKTFAEVRIGADIPLPVDRGHRVTTFAGALMQCAHDGGVLLVDEEVKKGETVHAIMRRVAVNPVTGAVALAVAILAVVDNRTQSTPITYANIARALSLDYRYLYYVDLETERFVQYSSSVSMGDLSLEQHGENFFAASRHEARRILHEADRAGFVEAFTKERVIHDIDQNGSFTISYRQIIDGSPRYMSLKAMRIGANDEHIIVGVSDIDAQVRERRTLERVHAEQVAYTRMMALTSEYLCVYVVDAQTDHYMEYRATKDYEGLGLAKEGEDFFGSVCDNSVSRIHVDDQERLVAEFTKQKVLAALSSRGVFSIDYRLILSGVPTHVSLKAALVEEPDGQKIVIGVSRAD